MDRWGQEDRSLVLGKRTRGTSIRNEEEGEEKQKNKMMPCTGIS